MSPAPKRYRGVVLTERGLERLESAIATAQEQQKYGKRFTQAELEELTGISIKTIKKIRQGDQGVDHSKIAELFTVFGLALETADYGLPELTPQASEPQPTLEEERSAAKIDWGEKPDTAIFFGRTEDLATLGQWVMAEQCRVVTLLGMGGIGKTSLAAKLADQIYEQFNYVIWRSLREAPPLDEILVRLIQFLSDQQETEINLPGRLGERIIRLLHYLRQHRCLLVLDNLESILQAESAGRFRDGYEGYGELIHRIGEAEHQSCLLLTSRECPRELAPMASDRLPVRLWSVTGIDPEAGREILKAKGLELDETNPQGQELIHRYSGNPQALHLVATAIQREFLGDVDDFLEEEGAAVEDVRSLLDQHLTRLAPLERSILFWLAINREPVGLDELMEDLLPPVTKREVRSALRGLSDRYLIETVGKQFTLQNVIMEFATDRFVEQVVRELSTQQFDLFHSHALIKATAIDYVRETQIRLILKPLENHIDSNLEKLIVESLQIIRQNSTWQDSYISGNLLNLICQIRTEVRDVDFSSVALRQVYLKGVLLRAVNFKNSLFIQAALTQPFSRIHQVTFSPDGKLIATGDSVGRVQIWRISDYKLLTTLYGHVNEVRAIAFSPNGQLLATGGADSTLRLWDVKQEKCLHVFKEHIHYVWSVSFSPDGQLLASSSADFTIRLWRVKQQKCLHVFKGHAHYVWSVSFSPDGRLLASGSGDSTIRLWDLDQKECLHIFEGHTDWVRSVVFSPDGQLLISSGSDSTVRLWDVRKQKCLKVFTEHTSWVRSVAVSPNGKFLASGGADSTIRLWDIHQKRCLDAFIGHTDWVRSVAISPDNNFLVSGSEDSSIRLWDLRLKRCLHVFAGHTNRIGPVTFSSDGKLLASGGSDSIIRLWDIHNKTCLYRLEESSTWLESLVFDSNCNFLYSSNAEHIVRKWNLQDRQCTQIFKGYKDRIKTINFGPGEEIFGSLSSDGSIQVWDVLKQRCLCVFEGNFTRLSSSAFSPDNQSIACTSFDFKIWLCDLQEKQCLHVFEGHTDEVKSIAFSPNGRLLASSSRDKTIRLWDIRQRQCIHIFEGHTDWVGSVSFSQDGQSLVSGSGDCTIRVWNIQQRQCIHIFEGHTDWIGSVSFHPNNRVVGSGSNDGTIRLWDFQTESCLAILRVPSPYEDTNITGVRGLTEAQRASMLALGAVDHTSKNHHEN